MRLHILQHELFEEPGYILDWAKDRGFSYSVTRFHMMESLPRHNQYDMLIIMGGPMSVHDENKYPWLATEKKFLKEAIAHQKKIVGICLGSQLLALVLEAKVFRNQWKEIGFFEVIHSNTNHAVTEGLPRQFIAFHWHGDTFDLPSGCELLYSSQACKHQAYIWNKHVLGLQFHLEVTPELLQLFLDNADEELKESGPFIQTVSQMREKSYLLNEINSILGRMLDNFVKL
ncbi:MAG: type 1 glutamine amidotransferase [Bacteroidales bacterium]|nr:type 1 glutamine amidotransferase [Bacteroidales bacterium]